MCSDFTYFKLRLPSAMHAKISAMAAENHRSINSEVILLLSSALVTTEAEERTVAFTRGGEDALNNASAVVLEEMAQKLLERLHCKARELEAIGQAISKSAEKKREEPGPSSEEQEPTPKRKTAKKK